MIETGQLRKVVDEDSIMLGILGGELLLVIDFNVPCAMVEVLMQNGGTTRFTDHWMNCHTEVVNGG